MAGTDGNITEELVAKTIELARLRLLDELVDEAEQITDIADFKALLRKRRKEAMRGE